MRVFFVIIMLIAVSFSFTQALANKNQCIDAVSEETTSPEQTCTCIFDAAANNTELQSEIIKSDGIPEDGTRSETLQNTVEACST